MKNIFRISGLVLLIILIYSCKKDEPPPAIIVTDVDGNIYHTVTIGKQVWMVENLKTTKYRNGDPIPNVTDNTNWSNLTTGAYSNCNNDANNSTPYGILYNWYAVTDSRNIAPSGWHIPSDAEWTTLAIYLGGETIAGKNLKETGNLHWTYSKYIDPTSNDTGFSALPGGARFTNPLSFVNFGYFGYWWSTSEGSRSLVNPSEYLGIYRLLAYNTNELTDHEDRKAFGLSVRCLKD